MLECIAEHLDGTMKVSQRWDADKISVIVVLATHISWHSLTCEEIHFHRSIDNALFDRYSRRLVPDCSCSHMHFRSVYCLIIKPEIKSTSFN